MSKTIPSLSQQGDRALNMDELLDAINKASVVSFDFFDTLFVRPLSHPEDAFDLLGIKLHIADFRAQRRNAQAQAFRQMTKDRRKEITLENIYEKFPLPHHDREAVQQAEYQLELELIEPNDQLFPLFQQLINSGKKVVITSDMYFSADFFIDVLRRYGLEHIPLFISADCNATKRDSGELFDMVAASCGVPAQQILHIGDNYLADVQRPQEKGLAAFHYERSTRGESDKKQSLVSSMINGLLNTRCAGQVPIASFQELGFSYGGPANLGFLEWIAQQTKLDAVDVVLFVSRDGFALERLAKSHFSGKLPEFHYFLGSRIAFNLASIDEGNFEQYIPFLLSGGVGLSPGELFERIGVRPPSAKVMLDLGIDPQLKIRLEDNELLSQLISAYRGEILQICSRNRRGLFMYLCQLGVNSGKKIALVDVGWNGTTQEAFELAIKSIMDISVVGYYLCLADTPECQRRHRRFSMKAMVNKDSVAATLVDTIYENRVAVEIFFSAPHNTVIGYRPNGLSVEAVNDPGRVKATNYEQISCAINQGIDQSVENLITMRQRLDIALTPLQTVAPLIELVTDTQWRVNPLIRQIENFDSWGSSRNQIMRFAHYFKN